MSSWLRGPFVGMTMVTSRKLKRAVIVAMVSMGVVKVAIHKIVHVIAVRDGLMSASRPVHVTGLVAAAAMTRRTAVGIVG